MQLGIEQFSTTGMELTNHAVINKLDISQRYQKIPVWVDRD